MTVPTLLPAVPIARRESRAGECWAIEEALAENNRKTLMPVYVAVVAVRAAENP